MSTTTPPPLLLGTPYVVSSSSAAPTKVTPSVCESVSQFKRVLASSRAFDDAITTRLNRFSALARGATATGETTECERVWQEVQQRWQERNRVLTYCDEVLAAGPGSTLDSDDVERDRRRRPVEEESGLSAEKGALGRGRSTQQQVKIQQLHQEFSIERIIRHRTLDLLASRCPSLSTTSTAHRDDDNDEDVVTVPRAIGQDGEEDERIKRRGRNERGGVRWA
ncbi:hypothetical protein JCM11491_005802 [Sporobolomyces phaffii]